MRTYWAHGKDGFDVCGSPNIYYGYSAALKDIPSNGATVEDDEGWGMLTGPDFGCVLHEEKHP